MADILTQLQDCLDQLSTQLYASLRYLSAHHPSSSLTPNQPPHPPTETSPSHIADDPHTFDTAKKELAQDLVFKVKQIEYLVGRLPGVENSKEKQESRIRELDGELREGERERVEGGREREKWLGRLEGVLGGCRR